MRKKMIQHRGSPLTEDTVEALRQLEVAAAKVGKISINFSSPIKREMNWGKVKDDPGPTGQPPHLSMRGTGREVYLRLKFIEDPLADESTRLDREVASLWALVVPLGFTPWDRYPVVQPTSHVFHYIGPWNQLYDHLIGEGRGEYAWPSVCSACQVDVGTWGGTARVERFVQAQLHRLGHNVGPVDGQIRSRTLAAIQAVGLHGLTLDAVALSLSDQRSVGRVTDGRTTGHVIIPNRSMTIASYGGVKSVRTTVGATLTVDGPGRLVVDVGASA